MRRVNYSCSRSADYDRVSVSVNVEVGVYVPKLDNCALTEFTDSFDESLAFSFQGTIDNKCFCHFIAPSTAMSTLNVFGF
jgi:hypothetical protein